MKKQDGEFYNVTILKSSVTIPVWAESVEDAVCKAYNVYYGKCGSVADLCVSFRQCKNTLASVSLQYKHYIVKEYDVNVKRTPQFFTTECREKLVPVRRCVTVFVKRR
jgi:hypothetical protein